MRPLIGSPVVRDFGRIAPFTDAVAAVALTALVLPLTSIHINENGTLAEFLHDYGSEIGAFLYGFFVISIFWAVHHKIWAMARQCTVAMLWSNMIWLLGIVVIPFGTVVLDESGGAVPVIGAEIFIGAMLVTTIGLGLLIYVISADPAVTSGLMPPQPFLWSMRYAVIWVLALLSMIAFPGVMIVILWIPGVLMPVMARVQLPSQRRWADAHPDLS